MAEIAPIVALADPKAILEVLLRPGDFRIADRSEYIPGLSRSFFLSADVLGWKRGKELKLLLARFFGRKRVLHLRSSIAAAVNGLDASLVEHQEFVAIACRQAMYAVLGVPHTEALHLEALFRIAGDQSGTDVGEAALELARQQVESLLHHPAVNPNGFIAWIRIQEGLTSRERVLLLLPFFEMLALGQHAVLAEAAVRSGLQSAKAAVECGTTKLDGIVLTRVATRTVTIAEKIVGAGSRILLDVTTSNIRAPTSDLCFGKGEHRCAGRLLALEIATAVTRKAMNVL